MELTKKKKVICYLIRKNNDDSEILVFDHRDYPDAGTQVIGGTVEEGESLFATMVREIHEEAGIRIKQQDLKKIGETEYIRKDRPELNERTYFLLENQNHLPDYWEHEVKSDGEDNGMVFCFYWISVKRAKVALTGNFAELIEKVPG